MELQQRKTAPADGNAAAQRAAGAVGGTAERGRRAEIVEKIRDLIAELDLKPGDRLPSERRLAARFGASRGSVREAIQYLAVMGLLEVRHGDGSHLLAHPEGQHASRWRQWTIEHRGKVLETLEVRLGMEVFAARLAAQRAGPEDVERLVAAMQAMREVCAKEPLDTARFVDCDITFHDALLRAGGNAVLRDLIRALSEALLPERAAVTALPGRVQKTYEEHFAIYEAVRSGDVDGAAEAMTRHIMSVRSDLLTGVLEEGRLETLPASRSVAD